jgi:spiro-SPASM protein
MKVAAVLYCEDGCTGDHFMFSGLSTISQIETAISSVPGIHQTLISLPSGCTGPLSSRSDAIIRSTDDISSWKELIGKCGADHVVRIFADAPFIDSAIIAEMLETHLSYSAEFTYSENLPAGLSCEIISGELISSLPETSEKRLPISQVVRSNINQFDVELFYKAPDLRDKRISFRTSNLRDKKIMESLYAVHGSIPKYSQLKTLIEKHCEGLYCGPSYVEIELTGRADVTAIYSYRSAIKDPRGDMDTALFSKIIAGLKDFSLPYSVCLGGSGDPLLHPDFYKCLDTVLAEQLVQSVFIETDGIAMDDGFLLYLRGKNDPRVKIIVDMSGYDDQSYKQLHGADSFQKILKNILSLRDLFGEKSDRLFVQIMKIRETENLIDKYYDFWEAQKVQIILQKHNSYLGAIEDRRYYDLTPLDRVPCWHLQRDLFILSDGRIAFCKQDFNGECSKWSCETEKLADIWGNRRSLFVSDYNGKRSILPDCSKCDEWYTFNM